MNPKWPQYEVAPVGLLEPDDITEYLRLIEDWKVESKQERDKWIEPVRNTCLDLFYTGESPKPPDSKTIPNHIKNNCIRVKDIMLKEPPAIEVKPLDDGGEPLAWYWNGPQSLPQMQTDFSTQQQFMVQSPVQAFGVPPDQNINGQMIAEPFDQLTGQHLQQVCKQNNWPDNWVVAVDMKLLGDVYQKPFDCYWLDCHANEWIDSFAMMVVKSGWETGQYQYDAQQHHSLETIPATQVFPDIRHQFIWDMDRFIVTRVYPVGTAMRLFPKQAAFLAEKAKPGLPTTTGATMFGYKDLRDFKGKVVTLTTIWLKDQPAPDWQSEDSAIQNGLATEQYSQPMLPPDQVMQQLPTSMPDPQRSVVDAKTGQPLLTNEDGMVWHDSWGMRNVLRQTVFLDRDLIEDDVCPWPRIPIMHAACVGIEDNPYGYGLPWGARHSQKTYSRSTESIDLNTDYYGNAAMWLPADVHAKMVREFGRAFMEPGDVLSLEKSDIPSSGKLDPFIAPPEIPESLIVARRENKADLDEIMGMQESLRGQPVTPNASGKLQDETAQQAIGLITAMSKQLQGAIGHLGDLMLYSVIHFTTVDEIYATCRTVRKEVLAAIHLRHAPTIKWRTTAMLSSGAGMSRDRKRTELFTLNQTPNKLVDDETVQEAYNLDPEQIRNRKQREQQDQLAVAAQQQAVMQPQQPAQPSSNGNGKHQGRGMFGE